MTKERPVRRKCARRRRRLSLLGERAGKGRDRHDAEEAPSMTTPVVALNQGVLTEGPPKAEPLLAAVEA